MINNRFVTSHFSELEQTNRSPIFDYEDSPLLTLEEAVDEITPSIKNYVATAKKKCNRRSILLTRDESASIYLYSMSSSLYFHLNDALRAEDREKLKPWFPFLKLFITALKKLPSVTETVWRGINFDDTSTFADDDEHIWWSVNSCSKALDVVQRFLGEKGTVYAINAIDGKDISAFSSNEDEHEVILMPGTCLRRRFQPLIVDDRIFLLHLDQINSSR